MLNYDMLKNNKNTNVTIGKKLALAAISLLCGVCHAANAEYGLNGEVIRPQFDYDRGSDISTVGSEVTDLSHDQEEKASSFIKKYKEEILSQMSVEFSFDNPITESKYFEMVDSKITSAIIRNENYNIQKEFLDQEEQIQKAIIGYFTLDYYRKFLASDSSPVDAVADFGSMSDAGSYQPISVEEVNRQSKNFLFELFNLTGEVTKEIISQVMEKYSHFKNMPDDIKSRFIEGYVFVHLLTKNRAEILKSISINQSPEDIFATIEKIVTIPASSKESLKQNPEEKIKVLLGTLFIKDLCREQFENFMRELAKNLENPEEFDHQELEGILKKHIPLLRNPTEDLEVIRSMLKLLFSDKLSICDPSTGNIINFAIPLSPEKQQQLQKAIDECITELKKAEEEQEPKKDPKGDELEAGKEGELVEDATKEAKTEELPAGELDVSVDATKIKETDSAESDAQTTVREDDDLEEESEGDSKEPKKSGRSGNTAGSGRKAGATQQNKATEQKPATDAIKDAESNENNSKPDAQPEQKTGFFFNLLPKSISDLLPQNPFNSISISTITAPVLDFLSGISSFLKKLFGN